MSSFQRYQLGTYLFADPDLHEQMRGLLLLEAARETPSRALAVAALIEPVRTGRDLEKRSRNLRSPMNAAERYMRARNMEVSRS